jgi:hypothetical protein
MLRSSTARAGSLTTSIKVHVSIAISYCPVSKEILGFRAIEDLDGRAANILPTYADSQRPFDL